MVKHTYVQQQLFTRAANKNLNNKGYVGQEFWETSELWSSWCISGASGTLNMSASTNCPHEYTVNTMQKHCKTCT